MYHILHEMLMRNKQRAKRGKPSRHHRCEQAMCCRRTVFPKCWKGADDDDDYYYYYDHGEQAVLRRGTAFSKCWKGAPAPWLR